MELIKTYDYTELNVAKIQQYINLMNRSVELGWLLDKYIKLTEKIDSDFKHNNKSDFKSIQTLDDVLNTLKTALKKPLDSNLDTTGGGFWVRYRLIKTKEIKPEFFLQKRFGEKPYLTERNAKLIRLLNAPLSDVLNHIFLQGETAWNLYTKNEEVLAKTIYDIINIAFEIKKNETETSSNETFSKKIKNQLYYKEDIFNNIENYEFVFDLCEEYFVQINQEKSPKKIQASRNKSTENGYLYNNYLNYKDNIAKLVHKFDENNLDSLHKIHALHKISTNIGLESYELMYKFELKNIKLVYKYIITNLGKGNKDFLIPEIRYITMRTIHHVGPIITHDFENITNGLNALGRLNHVQSSIVDLYKKYNKYQSFIDNNFDNPNITYSEYFQKK